MLLRKVSSDQQWLATANGQNGLISRRQLLDSGLTRAQAITNVDNGRWQRVHPGVYATFTGSLDPAQRVWGALLYAGEGAVACCATALWLSQVLDEKPETTHVSIPEARRVDPQPGLLLHRRRMLNRPSTPVHPAARPPRIRIEESLLDQCAVLAEGETVALILRATQRRLTTPGRIAAALERRSAQPRRALIRDLLAKVDQGVASPLELAYHRRVERAHALPTGERNFADADGLGHRRYRDVDYKLWRLVIELDGREAHPPDQAFRDLRRDNDVAVTGRAVLRYGWREVVGEPCAVAAQVGLALRQRGWDGVVGRCGAACAIPAPNGLGDDY